jgi:hypothetical protein
MKGLQRASLAAAAIALSLGWTSQVQRDRTVSPTESGTAVIEGRVVIHINETPQPVRRARLTLESEALPSARTTDSDTGGRYRFDKLPAGSYRVRVEKPGFVAFARDLRRAFDRPRPVEIAAAQTLQHDLVMVRGAAIEGRVLADNGQPAINIVVSAVRMGYDEKGRRPVTIGQTRSDDRGRFRVHSLPAGEYYLDAAPDPLDTLDQPTVPGRRPSMLSRVYFPDAPQIDGGRVITLATGQNEDGLSFTLTRIPAAVLSGRIVDSSGKPGTMMTVGARVQRVGGLVGEVRGSMEPQGGGFRYGRVPAGEYWLMGVARPSPSADLEYTVTRLTVAGEDVTNIILTTARGAAVNGKVEIDDGAASVLSTLQIVAHPTEFEPPTIPLGSPDDGSSVTVSADGAFSYPSLFGPRLLRVSRLPAGWALKSVSVDGVDVSDSPFDFKGGTRPLELRIVVTARTNRVTGIVRDAAGRPVRDARVVAFATEERAWGARSRMIKAVESDAEGRYVIDGLLDGAYHLEALPYLEEGAWVDPQVLRRLQPGSLLKVADRTQATVDLVVK